MHKLVEKLFSWCYPLLKELDLGETISAYLSLAVNIFILSVFTYVIYLVFNYILVRTMVLLARKTKTKFDDLLVSNKTAKYIAH